MADRHRVLFVAEAVTLAHVARLAALAGALDATRFEVCLACDARYNHVLGRLPFPVRALETIPTERFFRAIAQGSPIYDADTLAGYVAADRRLMHEFGSHAVVGDFRLSLGISARLAGVPYLNVSNAYWSPYAMLRYPVPDIPLVRMVGPGLAQRLFNIARPLAFALHAHPLNVARRRFGLPPLPADLRHVYTEADQVLYADVPELVPTRGMPAHHHFIGPIAWTPRVPLPDWWHDPPADRPIVYVTLGSSGLAARLPDIVTALSELPVSLLVASAGRPVPASLPGNVWVSDFLPGDLAAKRSALVVCNGGSPTSYQGLAAGVPVIGLASNLDQYLNMSLIADAEAGILMRAACATRADIQAAARRCLASGEMKARAVSLQAAIKRRDATAIFPRLLEQLLEQGHATIA
jgi:UDP:flavonoid glycosyltransferase YjiC (YdhE family)